MSRYGSLQNHLAAQAAEARARGLPGCDVDPEVGMGATRLYYTDRRPYTIVRVISPVTIEVQEDRATRADTNGMSECQSYTFEPDPDAPVIRVRLTKRGWSHRGAVFLLGRRECYHDHSF